MLQLVSSKDNYAVSLVRFLLNIGIVRKHSTTCSMLLASSASYLLGTPESYQQVFGM
ncbi:unnamed protein product [Acanthoscelides obtectus]|uniref:Uncharacterized protein n=1 Tax=Acanthoscelides obtectus TaxID=200917 RepID=A0A9P0PG41_ACAOB|nr:unnamed protein product [Acanthoscelides obtectus]CAK1675370.1 hypothetical protein AOBTE_LOCUS30172 [Acanthoscelides obtectus]